RAQKPSWLSFTTACQRHRLVKTAAAPPMAQASFHQRDTRRCAEFNVLQADARILQPWLTARGVPNGDNLDDAKTRTDAVEDAIIAQHNLTDFEAAASAINSS